ncbi:uncharacterized protein BO97DRAFT_412696 [Aspergillus homomorphus CBS 101889]|uniref:Uncharacterized protein n=1 Tax=Aspergillus homomorphus (strain CBS 101889) TaxID=1450537 RepID=A0A395I2J3_ASPHC|nr:hypothetical protein BO97DRAFT_412696 [Aspergillus homomorphus CBS 101889]RAL14391.1 hypothetical protein BO97DRAFT_412696 [Aspergillus homomorphus CBS 101889]
MFLFEAIHKFSVLNVSPTQQAIVVRAEEGEEKENAEDDPNWTALESRLREIFRLLRARYPDAPLFHGICRWGSYAQCYRELQAQEERYFGGRGLYRWVFTGGEPTLQLGFPPGDAMLRCWSERRVPEFKHLTAANINIPGVMVVPSWPYCGC